MTYRGHVKNGMIQLDNPIILPEGSAVTVDMAEQLKITSPTKRGKLTAIKPIQLEGDSLADELVNDRR